MVDPLRMSFALFSYYNEKQKRELAQKYLVKKLLEKLQIFFDHSIAQ